MTDLQVSAQQERDRMARSMVSVLLCALMVSAVFLADLPMASSQDTAALEAETLGQYQQEEAQEIRLNEEMQKQQAESKVAKEGAQIGSRRLAYAQLAAVPDGHGPGIA